MKKGRSIKDQLAVTVRDSKIATEERLDKLDLNERISRAEAIVKSEGRNKVLLQKTIRDAFTMREADIEAIKEIKQRCLRADIDANKSLIVRAGIQVLATLSIEELKKIITNLPKIKIGRPKI